MVNAVQQSAQQVAATPKAKSDPYADRPKTLGERLIREARAELAGQSDTDGQHGNRRVIQDILDVTTTNLDDGTKAVNLTSGQQHAADIRTADRTELAEKLDRGLAEGFRVGALFRGVIRAINSFFEGGLFGRR